MENPIRILLVEDDDIDRMAFVRFIKQHSMSVDYVIARSIYEAQEKLLQYTFDIVISDFSLGDGTALELFSAVGTETPMIVVTGTGNEETAVRAMKEGASDYIIKDSLGNYLKILPQTLQKAIDRKKAEKELELYRRQLEELVKERTAELEEEINERKRVEAELRQAQKLEAIGTLAGGIAHDFNNILSAIFGFSELALIQNKGIKGKEGDKLRKNLKEVINAAERARGLVRQILTFSRQGEQEMKPIDISAVIKDALKLLRSSLPSFIEMQQYIPDESYVVMGDPTQVHQIILNLCVNARDAMKKDGGILRVDLQPVRLMEGSLPGKDLPPGEYLEISVSDTGSGIPVEIMEHIFDPYFTTKKIGEGTGLGLSVVHGIVRHHGGEIMLYSEPGNGTVFHIYLPRVEMEKETSQETMEVVGGNERILFVDDEYPLVKVAREMLSELGYKVTATESSISALRAFRANPNDFDLVITDMTMPNIKGDELAKKLTTIRPDIPVVLCPGFAAGLNREELAEMGICKVVLKPLLRRNIAAAIREVLDRPREAQSPPRAVARPVPAPGEEMANETQPKG